MPFCGISRGGDQPPALFVSTLKISLDLRYLSSMMILDTLLLNTPIHKISIKFANFPIVFVDPGAAAGNMAIL